MLFASAHNGFDFGNAFADGPLEVDGLGCGRHPAPARQFAWPVVAARQVRIGAVPFPTGIFLWSRRGNSESIGAASIWKSTRPD
jgi:hypothetical protein